MAVLGVRGSGAWTAFRERWSRADGKPDDPSFDRFRPENASRPYFGLFRFDELGGVADEIVLRRRTPDAIEIDSHGGDRVVERIIDFFVSRGAVLEDGDSWSRRVEREESPGRDDRWDRAFGLPIREVFFDASETLVARASTDRIAKIAIRQSALWRRFFDALSTETRLDARAALLDDLIARGISGRRLVEPIVVPILGAPNVGKSSLLNALLGRERAVVSETPGTTRDLVGASLVLDGWNFRLVDAAGLRETDDPIEREGARLAAERAETANFALFVCDARKSREEGERAFARFLGDSSERLARNGLRVLNKTDLPESERSRDWLDAPGDWIKVSARTGAGLDRLARALVEKVDAGNDRGRSPEVWNERQMELLKEARDATRRGARAKRDFDGSDSFVHRV